MWSSDSSGNWSDTSKWAGGVVADGPDSNAYFTNDITAIRTVTLDIARTNGNLFFGDGDTGTPGGWLLTSTTLGLSNSIAKPTIFVDAINPAGNTNDAWIASVVAGTQGFIKTGPGVLTLAGNNTALTTAGIFVQQGTLVCGSVGAFGPTAFTKTNQLDGGTLRLIATPNNHTWQVTANGGTIILTNIGALNLNGPLIGSGTLKVIATAMLTLGNNTGNVFSNFNGTLDLNGVVTGGQLRVDPGSGNVNIGSPNATFDLGNTNAILFTRYNLAGGTNIFFMGALKGGPLTLLRATGQGLAGGSLTIFQVGNLNLPTTFSGNLTNGTGGSGIQMSALTKVGTSTLTLTGTNYYSGATTISNGSLILGASGSISFSSSIFPLGTGIFDVSSYAGLWTNGVNQNIGGSGTVTGGVTMVSGYLTPGLGTNVARLTFADALTVDGTVTNLFKTGFGTNDSVLVQNNLTLNGVTTVQIVPPAGASLIPNGTYPLFRWTGTLTGDLNNLSLVYPAQVGGSTLVLQTNLVTKTISLFVTNNAAGTITWRGDGINNFWDHSSPNWRTSGGGAALFSELDAVIFDDSGSNNIPVNLTDILTPSSLSVSNVTHDYIFSGAGKVTGVTGLTKNGSGKLTVVNENDFSGGVTINAGAIQVGDGAANGASGSLGVGSVVNNGTLIYNRSDNVTLSNPLLGSGTLVQNGTNTLTFALGTLILTADNSANNALVSNGTLQLGDGTSGQGSMTGIITNNATLRYFYNNDATLKNSLAGNGVINFDAASGNRTYTWPLAITNNAFTGTMNLAAGVRVHADTGNAGYQFGSTSTVNVPLFAGAWVDTSATNYTATFNIAGTGWTGDQADSTLRLGALRLFNCTVTGPVNLMSDARIGGSSSGATIQGQISGNFQLEVFGNNANVDQFILTLAPAAGPNAYASTLITRGVLQAGNTNAFTNSVTMTGLGRLRLNGNNISISSLSGGTAVNGTNALVWNSSTASAATLSVGSDGNSAFFDGIFGNGATQPLGLTKVGGGTLTLTAISSNTGPVTVGGGTLTLQGDGSFSNSAQIAVSSGAILDVTTRNDGSLYLNNGQTLKGGGTVNGSVIALAGATVAPGNSVGTLNVQGNITLGGTLQMELNRTNTPNNSDRLTASGTITYGGTLTATNIGPALQTNDTFQLFPSGVSGFTAFNLATNDGNNKVYTWQNNIATLGSIKVLTVAQGVNLTPTNITLNFNGNALDLSWPADHTGWTLQTNAGNVLNTNSWFPYPNSSTTNHVVIPVNRGQGNVFFRLHYP
jgi:fibronectin-binding autotransporter adhesin